MILKLHLLKKIFFLVPFFFCFSKTFSQTKIESNDYQIISELQQTTKRNSSQIVLSNSQGEAVEYNFKEIDNGFPAELKKKFPEIRIFEGTSMADPKKSCIISITKDRIYGTSYSEGKTGDFYNIRNSATSKMKYEQETTFDITKCGECSLGSNTKCAVQDHEYSVVMPDHDHTNKNVALNSKSAVENSYSRGSSSKTYRFALSVTYAQNVQRKNTTVAEGLAFAALRLAGINRVLGLELAIKLEFIPNEDLLIFLTPNGPFPDEVLEDSLPLIDLNQTTIDNIIGRGNYDWGLVIHPCSIARAARRTCGSGNMAQAAALDSNDVILHEMGHQMNCPHSYHLDGSGKIKTITTSIVSSNGGRWFHSANFERAAKRIDQDLCGVSTPTGNTVPIISIPLGNGLSIPKSTPFALKGYATDPDPTAKLTYAWQQVLLESEADIPEKELLFAHPNPSATTNIRHIPDVSYQISKTYDPSAILPTISRDIVTRFIVRDNQEPFGATAYQEISFKVDATAGPFLVTSPNEKFFYYSADQEIPVTWDVANTNNSAVNVQFVNILLSIDQGNTWTTLTNNVPNNGSCLVTLPNTPSKLCRIKIEAVGNIFYDISDSNFEITDKSVKDFAADGVKTFNAIYNLNSSEFKFKFSKLGSFSNKVNVSVKNLPAGTTVDFPNELNNSGNFSVMVSGINNIAFGRYTMTIELEDSESKIVKKIPITLVKKSPGDDVAGNYLNLKTGSQYATAQIDNITTNTLTISAWVKPKTGSVYSGIVFFNDNTGISIEPTGQLKYYYRGSYWDFSEGPYLNLDQWSFIALVIEPYKATFYLNGRPSSVTNDVIHLPALINSITIGRQRSGRNFLGGIDEVKIFNKSLSAIEIQEQMHKTVTYNDPDLIAYYQFNEKNGDAICPVSYLNATLMGKPEREVSTIPTGNAFVKTLPGNSDLIDFSSTDVSLKFETNSNQTTSIHKIMTSPYNLSGIPVEEIKDGINNYWEINNYPNPIPNKVLEAVFKLNSPILSAEKASDYTLYTRDQISDEKWEIFAQASSLDYKQNSVVFQNLPSKGQYVIGKKGINLGMNEENLFPDNLMIYKNKNEIMIETAKTPISAIKIYNILGRLIYSKKDINDTKEVVNLNIANQILIIQVSFADNQNVSRKFIY